MRRLYSSLLLFGLAAALAYFNRTTLSDTVKAGSDVSPVYLIFLGLIAVALIFARGALVAATIPGLSIPRAALADQAALSAAYGIAVGGGPVGVAAKITMFRHWGVTQSAIGASLVATAVIPTFTTWGPAVAVHLPMTVQGDASRVETLVVVVGVITIVFNIVFWAGVLYLNGPIHYIASLSQWLQRFVGRVTPTRWTKASKAVHAFDPEHFVHSTRGDLRTLFRARIVHMMSGATSVMLISFCAFFVSLQAFEVEGVSFIEALSAFALVRVVVALSPLPGGVGLAEISLVALLTNAGANDTAALGATLLYRCVVWLTPLVVGGIGWWWWSRQHLWTREIPLANIDNEVSADDVTHRHMECRRCHPQTMLEESSDFLATSQ